MTQVTVSEAALRELVKEALDGGHLGNLAMPEEEMPVSINPVVDQSAAVTDPINPDFVPQTKPELDVALKQLTKDVPIDNVPKFYKLVQDAVEAEELQDEEDAQMKKAAEGGTTQVEEAIRRAVRKVLGEAPLPPVRKIPFGVHGKEYMDSFQHAKDSLKSTFGKGDPEEELEAEPEDLKPKKRGAYKTTAIGNMEDVSGKSFQEIAKELGFSVAGAKQAVDKALEKARFLAVNIDPDDLEIMILQTMNEYIGSLSKTGELSAADVQLMKDHPEIVRELDGFREFLATAIKRKRKEGQEVESPIGEANDYGMTKVCPFCKQDVKTVTTSAGEYFEAHNKPDGSDCHGSKSRANVKLGEAKKKSVMLKCPDCGGSGWDDKADKDCELCAGHGQISKRDLYGEQLVREVFAFTSDVKKRK